LAALIVPLAIGAYVLQATGASAYWDGEGTGSGSAADATLAAPTLTATPGAESVQLSWTAVTPPGAGTVEYYVTRDGGSPSSHCPSAASRSTVTSCTDEPVSIGAHEYAVTAVWRTWTGTSEARSANVTYGPAAQFKLEASKAEVTAGESETVTITALDAHGNTVPSYAGSRPIAFSGPANSPSRQSPSYPAAVSFTGGVGTASPVKLYDAQTTTLTAKEGSLEGTSGSITVKAAAAARWAWAHAKVTAGGIESSTCLFECTTNSIGNNQKFKAHVSVTDEYGNIVSNLGAGHKAEVTKNSLLGTLTNATAIEIPSAGPAESATVLEYTSPLVLSGEAKLSLKAQEGTAYTEATATVKY
jgi:hypothetical protein